MSNFHDVYSLLQACVQRELDIARLQEKIEFITKTQQWDLVFTRANSHGIFPLVYSALNHPELNIDPQIVVKFRDTSFDLARTNMLMTSELIRVATLFDQHKIDMTVFKGPALSQLIHQNIVDRQYVDLDLLVSEDVLYEAALLLLENGYKTEGDAEYLKNRAYVDIGKDVGFYHEKFNIKLELHWRLAEKKLMIREEGFFSARQTVQINGVDFQTLRSDSLLLYLCIHGSKHYWERLEWIVDVDRLITQSKDLNWEEIVEEAKILEVNRLFYSGLMVVQSLLNTALPPLIVKMINEDASYLVLKEKIIKKIFEDDITQKSSAPINVGSISLNAEFKDSKKAVLKSKLRGYLQLKEGDIKIVNLPSYLTWVYYLLRPFRIILKYIK